MLRILYRILIFPFRTKHFFEHYLTTCSTGAGKHEISSFQFLASHCINRKRNRSDHSRDKSCIQASERVLTFFRFDWNCCDCFRLDDEKVNKIVSFFLKSQLINYFFSFSDINLWPKMTFAMLMMSQKEWKLKNKTLLLLKFRTASNKNIIILFLWSDFYYNDIIFQPKLIRGSVNK